MNHSWSQNVKKHVGTAEVWAGNLKRQAGNREGRAGTLLFHHAARKGRAATLAGPLANPGICPATLKGRAGTLEVGAGYRACRAVQGGVF